MEQPFFKPYLDLFLYELLAKLPSHYPMDHPIDLLHDQSHREEHSQKISKIVIYIQMDNLPVPLKPPSPKKKGIVQYQDRLASLALSDINTGIVANIS